MNKVLFTFLVLAATNSWADAFIDPALKTFALGASSAGTQRVLILTKGVAPVQKPARYDRAGVVRYFQEASRLSIAPLMNSLQNNQVPGVKFLQAFWINGAVLADVTREGLVNLSKQPSVTKIYRNGIVHKDPPVSVKSGHGPVFGADPFGGASSDYHFTSIGLDRLMKELPQVVGTGVTVGLVDTGVDATHPALQGKVPLFFNGQTRKTSPPQDFDQHGTHVSGTVAGGDRTNNLIGVAPGAKIVMAGVVEQGFDAMLSGMQFFLDQRQNPAASSIKVVGCSWNTGGAPDQEVFYRAIAAWEAAGILPVFSAGNAGAQGITHPHEYPGTFAIAAFGADGNIASFSSVGPGHYHGQDTQKPDIAAPGVDINSSVPGGNYEQMSGTSMAQPHASGTAALLLQVKPDLNPAQLKILMTKSAVPTQGRSPGQWDAHWGFGSLNAYNAVKAAQQFTAMTYEPSNQSLADFVATPESLEVSEISHATLGEVGGEVDQFKDTDPNQWMTFSETLNGLN